MHANNIRTIGQSAFKSSPMSPNVNTKPTPAAVPPYLQHPAHGAKQVPRISPRHIYIDFKIYNKT